MSDLKVYGPEQQNAFFQGTYAAAEEKAADWGVNPNVILGDFIANALACLIVGGTEDEFASVMIAADEKARAVLNTRALRKDVTGE